MTTATATAAATARPPRVQIIDYKLGNLFSVQQACRHFGLDAIVSDSPETLPEVDGLILPGVGAFGNAMENLRNLGLLAPLREVVQQGKPLFGVCLGMQLLFEESEEFGRHEGLGLLPGRICRLPAQTESSRKLRVPNVGWHEIQFSDSGLSQAVRCGIPDRPLMYFVHSFYAEPADAADTLTMTEYGAFRYCSGVHRQNILGVQFHPEKSGRTGLRFYENWAATLRPAGDYSLING